MATTASSTVNAADHLAINSMPLSVNTSSCSSSSAKTSLFDRVANFRRSLIKSQQKKNKIRPTSGTFNFFKSNFSSSSLASVETATATNDATKSSVASPGHSFDSAECAVIASKNNHPKHLGASSPAAASASNLRDAIAVDEEDAIYGFTSSRLNNQTSLRRQLNKSQQQQQQKQSSQPAQSRQSTNSSIKQTSTSSSSPTALFTSSSCISLYETIDEVEPISVGPVSSLSSADSTASFKAHPPPVNAKTHFQPNYNCKVRAPNSASTRQLRLSSMHDSDWKRNRRSSAIIFGSDFHGLMIDDNDNVEPTSMVVGDPTSGAMNGHRTNHHSQQQQHHRHQHPKPQQQHHHFSQHHRNNHPPNGYHLHQNGHHYQQQVSGGNGGKSVVHSAGYSHLHHHPHQLNHSSDDLLLMAHQSQAQFSFMNQYHPEVSSASSAADSSVPGGESVKPYVTGRIYENLLNSSFSSAGHSQHSHHKRSENRKLTKDSGYESASTLVSLTQLNGCTGVSGLQSSPLPPPASVNSTSPPVHQQHPQHYQQSNGVLISSLMGNSIHCRSDSFDSANSLCGDVLQSPSPPVPKCHSNSPPLPPPPPLSIGVESVTDDLRPPTPPVRYSSLSQNRSFLHQNHRDSSSRLPLPPPPLPPPPHSSVHNNSTDRPWSHQLQSSFDSSTDCQTGAERSSLKELRAKAFQAPNSTNLPFSIQPAESLVEPTPPLYNHHHHHHAKQDSWPIVSNSGLVSSSTVCSGSPSTIGGSHHQLVNKPAVLPSRTGDTSLASAAAAVGNSTPAHGAPVSSQLAERQYQRQQSYPATPYAVYNSATNTIMTQSSSLSSLTSMINSVNCNSSAPSASVRPNIASCSTSALQSAAGQAHLPTNGSCYNSQPAPSAQIARSQRVHQAARQELCMPAPKQRLSLETSLDDIIGDAQTEGNLPPPPPLPPKNVGTNLPSYCPTSSTGNLLAAAVKLRPKSSPEQAFNSNEIKAIQKRAVYEFYLRQKEKKDKAKLCSPPESPSRNNSSGSSNGSIASSMMLASLSSECTLPKSYSEHEDDGIIEEELLPLPTPPLPPPPLPVLNDNSMNTNSTVKSNRFFADVTPPSQTDAAFPPPPTPVATESPAFPPPPTPLPTSNQHNSSALTFPPPSSSIEIFSSTSTTTTSIKSLSNSKLGKQMFYCIDLSTLWPTTDFSGLLEPLPMPPPVKESNLDDDGTAEEDDEELASIEANRERVQAVEWRLSQLELEQKRIDEELAENESIIGSLVRNRFSADATLAIDQNKLELLAKDMIMIIRLMTSIVQQLTLTEPESKVKKVQPASKSAFSGVSPTVATTTNHSVIETKKCADNNGTLNSDANDVVNSYSGGVHCLEAKTATSSSSSATTVDADLCQEKRMRLLGQLEEAKRLRDNIETRRTMLEQRLARKCATRNSSDQTTATLTTAATNQSSMLLISDAGSLLVGSSAANDPDGYQALANDRRRRSQLTAPAAAFLYDDIDLTTLVRLYLTRKEHLLVQQEVGKLLHAELHTRIEANAVVAVGRRPSEQANMCAVAPPLN